MISRSLIYKLASNTATTTTSASRLISSSSSSLFSSSSSLLFNKTRLSTSTSTSSSSSSSSTSSSSHKSIYSSIIKQSEIVPLSVSPLSLVNSSRSIKFKSSSPSSPSSLPRYYSSNSSNNNNKQQQEKGYQYGEKQQQDYTSKQWTTFNFNRRIKRGLLLSSGGSLILLSAIGFFGGSGGSGSSNNNNNNGNNGNKENESIWSNIKIKESWKVLGGIIAVNGIVFLLLQSPAFLSRYGQHFLCSVTNVPTHPLCLILSNFSHIQPLHFAFNMIGLWSFGQTAHDYMGTLPFLALYLGGGLVGTMTSITQKLITSNFAVPSIGASGCVFSVIGASTFFEPNNRVAFIFFPFASIDSLTALYALIAFDILGILYLGRYTGWDHSCHLGSCLVGATLAESYRYKARFQHFTGSGKTTTPGLYTYQGQFKDGAFNGQGHLLNLPTGDVFKGQFQDNELVRGQLSRNGQLYNVQRPLK